MLFGDKTRFAIEFNLNYIEQNNIFGQVSLWLNGEQIGDYLEKENMVEPFLTTLSYLVNKYNDLWDDDFEGLSCSEIFYRISPYYNNQEKFYELSEFEIDELIRLEKFKFNGCESLDQWIIRVIVKNNECKFIYTSVESFNIKCHIVSLTEYLETYNLFLQHIKTLNS